MSGYGWEKHPMIRWVVRDGRRILQYLVEKTGDQVLNPEWRDVPTIEVEHEGAVAGVHFTTEKKGVSVDTEYIVDLDPMKLISALSPAAAIHEQLPDELKPIHKEVIQDMENADKELRLIELAREYLELEAKEAELMKSKHQAEDDHKAAVKRLEHNQETMKQIVLDRFPDLLGGEVVALGDTGLIHDGRRIVRVKHVVMEDE